jgi:tetratricopeptide (TPR) repeat protein
LIEEIVGFVENLTPIALIGAGGIGKTSIALTVLHHHRVKQRFGENRRFVRCDQFPATVTHLLNRLSKVTGAGVENPEDLAPLQPFLSSREMLIILDNAESILDPRGTDAAKLYALVEELSRLEGTCLVITSRISTVPPECEIIDVPTLSTNAARDIFYSICKKREQSNLINNILEQLDCHPLSIMLLATVAHENRWSPDRLAREWERRRTSVLQTEHNKSLAAAIELSLASPLFQDLGPDARGLLGVVAFFPQGVDENNVDWLFPTISNGTKIFDKFCILSLTYRNDGFITMLAPLRDHLSPKDPGSSSLLCATKEHYFTRMSVDVDPEEPNFRETRWIISEDVNVEHLLDVFTTIDPKSDSVWNACANFMQHLHWHKKRLVILKPKIEGIPDDRNSKPKCLFELSRLFHTIGNLVECKRFLVHSLKLWRDREDHHQVARVLDYLSDTNRLMDLPKEGIQQAKEALKIYEQLGDTVLQAQCFIVLSRLLCADKQLDAAEEAAFRAINLLPEEGEQYLVCGSNRALGDIYESKGEIKKVIHHNELALGIASPFGWHDHLFWAHYKLAGLSRIEGRLDGAQAHVELAKSHTVDSTYNLGLAMEEQAYVWYKQDRLEEARNEALRAADIHMKLGAVKDVERCRKFAQRAYKKN